MSKALIMGHFFIARLQRLLVHNTDDRLNLHFNLQNIVTNFKAFVADLVMGFHYDLPAIVDIRPDLVI